MVAHKISLIISLIIILIILVFFGPLIIFSFIPCDNCGTEQHLSYGNAYCNEGKATIEIQNVGAKMGKADIMMVLIKNDTETVLTESQWDMLPESLNPPIIVNPLIPIIIEGTTGIINHNCGIGSTCKYAILVHTRSTTFDVSC